MTKLLLALLLIAGCATPKYNHVIVEHNVYYMNKNCDTIKKVCNRQVVTRSMLVKF